MNEIRESPSMSQVGPPPGGREEQQTRQVSFHGAAGSLFGIHIVNLCLGLVTLGIYSFWGRVRVRKYLMSQTEFEGDRFAYHGTGKELLIGWLKAVLVFGVPFMLLRIGPEVLGGDVYLQVAAGLLLYAIIMVFVPIALVGARRYRLSRTSWRAIRFSFRGRTADFIKLFIKGMLLTMVTVGLYYPMFDVRRHAFMASHSYFGNRRFDFDGHGRDLFRAFLLAVLLTPLTLGIYWFWYQAKKQRYLWGRTAFATARFHSSVTGGRLLRLKLGNLVLLLVSLGLAWPLTLVRSVRFAYRYVLLRGPLDLAGIQQEAQIASATGEALSGFLDTGFFDFDLG